MSQAKTARTARVPGVRIYDAELQLLRDAAEADGKELNEWVRDTLLREAAVSTEGRSPAYENVVQQYDNQPPPWIPKVNQGIGFLTLGFSAIEWPKIVESARKRAMTVRDWCQKVIRESGDD